MALGLPTGKAEIDAMAGRLAYQVDVALRNAQSMQAWLLTKTDGDLTALGYTSGEVAILKSAFTKLNQLAAIYQGAQNLAVAEDFRTFPRQIFGFGV
jgi:hypothetical protein